MRPMSLGERLVIRRLRETDSWVELTELLHRAYAPLAAEGMKFFATHQTEEHTRLRALAGECYVAELDGRVVATITLKGPPGPHQEGTRVPHYNEPGVYTFGQLGVDPAHKGLGIGEALMSTVEARAKELAGVAIALDTAVRATKLIAMYERRGYRPIGNVQWDDTNYLSVVMSKVL
jgi:GNAT superfamily N-acetyltransferase